MKIFLIICQICLLPLISFAESGEARCVNGNCEGWSLSYENKNDITANYTLYNNTGKPAFNINYRLLFYTYHDEFVTSISKNIAGPLSRKRTFSDTWPHNASKVQFEIYSNDKQP